MWGRRAPNSIGLLLPPTVPSITSLPDCHTQNCHFVDNRQNSTIGERQRAPPHHLGDEEKRCKLPQRGSGRSSDRKRILEPSRAQKTHLEATILYYLYVSKEKTRNFLVLMCGSHFCGAPVRPNTLKMLKSASEDGDGKHRSCEDSLMLTGSGPVLLTA